MKKIALLILTSFISALAFSLTPALGAEKKIKVYYSESLGTGEKVYHITTCQKIPAMGVVTCDKNTRGQFGAQCDEDKDEGDQIMGCIKRDNQGNTVTFPGTTYAQVDTDKIHLKAPQGCSDEPEDKGFLFGKLYALVPGNPPDDNMADNDFDESKIRGQQVLPLDNRTYPAIPQGLKRRQLFQTGLCAVYDVPENAPGEQPPADVQALLAKIEGSSAAHTNFVGENGAKCNASEHTSRLDPTTSASCTYVERITGDTGADIIGQYIGTLYKWAASIIGIIAVLGIVYSGIQMSVAGGNTALVDEAKANIGKSLLAMAILFLSGLILYTINPTFFTGGG